MNLLWILLIACLGAVDAASPGETRPGESGILSGKPLVAPTLTAGPLLGAAGPTEAHVWARADAPGAYTLIVRTDSGLLVAKASAHASPGSDYCLNWHVEGLDPGRRYPFWIQSSQGRLEQKGPQLIRTPLRAGNSSTRIAFGSCSNDYRFPEQPIWEVIRRTHHDTLVLLGDTPYIDSTDLGVQRARYQTFLKLPDVRKTLARLPWYATWDDHDFGRNDTDGRLEGKQHSRRAFVEAHAGPEVGRDGEGIFTSFRRGPVEVFLLDTRWFAGVESMPGDSRHKSLLGMKQWEWLQNGLQTSTATFKLLACGMVWNGAVRPHKRDHWMSYPRDRTRLLRFIGEENIRGVVLIGGDIHRSRALRHPTRKLAGYDLTELITSPLANTVIASANVASPALLHDIGVQETFLSIEVDARSKPARLRARFIGRKGETIYELELSESELRTQTP